MLRLIEVRKMTKQQIKEKINRIILELDTPENLGDTRYGDYYAGKLDAYKTVISFFQPKFQTDGKPESRQRQCFEEYRP